MGEEKQCKNKALRSQSASDCFSVPVRKLVLVRLDKFSGRIGRAPEVRLCETLARALGQCSDANSIAYFFLSGWCLWLSSYQSLLQAVENLTKPLFSSC